MVGGKKRKPQSPKCNFPADDGGIGTVDGAGRKVARNTPSKKEGTARRKDVPRCQLGGAQLAKGVLELARLRGSTPRISGRPPGVHRRRTPPRRGRRPAGWTLDVEGCAPCLAAGCCLLQSLDMSPHVLHILKTGVS